MQLIRPIIKITYLIIIHKCKVEQVWVNVCLLSPGRQLWRCSYSIDFLFKHIKMTVNIYLFMCFENENLLICYNLFKFYQWNIHKPDKSRELPLHPGAALPFLTSNLTSGKEIPKGRLFSFDSEGQYLITCDRTAGSLYKVIFNHISEWLYCGLVVGCLSRLWKPVGSITEPFGSQWFSTKHIAYRL